MPTMPSSIPLPRIKFGKIKERSQMCEVLTDDGRMIDKEFPVLYSCMDDESTGMAYMISPENQYKAEDGTMHQILTEKSQVPVCLRSEHYLNDGVNDEKELENIGNEIFGLTFDQKMAEGYQKISDSSGWNKIILIVSIVMVTLLLIVGITTLWG